MTDTHETDEARAVALANEVSNLDLDGLRFLLGAISSRLQDESAERSKLTREIRALMKAAGVARQAGEAIAEALAPSAPALISTSGAEKPKRVLILDIDGVLACSRVHLAYAERGLWSRPDPVGVQFLNRLHERTGCAVVVSSTWRKRMTRSDFESLMREAGWTGTLHEDWATPDTTGRRGDEITAWLERHPEVEVWAAFDDDSDYDPGMPLVQTDAFNGISMSAFRRAMELLAGERYDTAPDAPAGIHAWTCPEKPATPSREACNDAGSSDGRD